MTSNCPRTVYANRLTHLNHNIKTIKVKLEELCFLQDILLILNSNHSDSLNNIIKNQIIAISVIMLWQLSHHI